MVGFFVFLANFDSGEDSSFLKHFYFSTNFTNFLKNICVHLVSLKIWVLNQEKKF